MGPSTQRIKEKPMPFIHIRVAGENLPETKVQTLQTETTRLMAEILHKKAELTAVFVEQVSPGSWSVGSASVPAAAHMEATITAGTNTEEEKARFVGQAMTLLKSISQQKLPLATYVVLREIAAESWGYDGQTQAARRIAST